MQATEPLALVVDSELAGWRRRIDDFLGEAMAPERWADHVDPRDLTGLDESFERAHHLAAGAEGFLAIAVPATLGGGGRPRSWKHIYDFLAAWHDAPSIDSGVTLCGAPLALFGSARQHERWLDPMAAGRILACVAYSEPAAGTDLAAITTDARRDADGWLLSGTKSLITGAHKADVALVLARTGRDGPARSAMSMFLVPLDSIGVSIERRETINGWTLEDITFDAVLLGADALLGTEGEGWKQVMAALQIERGSLAHLGWSARRLHDLPSEVEPLERARLIVDYGRAAAFAQRLLDRSHLGEEVGYLASATKVVSTELLARISRVAAAAAGERSRPGPRMVIGERFGFDALEWIHPTISVGANETHRDMIAAQILDGTGSTRSAPSLSEADDLIACCREMVDISTEAFSIARDRILSREVFGRRVADFQVVRHRVVDMYLTCEAMALTLEDLERRHGHDLDRARSIAKVIANEGVLDVCLGAQQLHGGEGYLDDRPLGALTRRAWALQADAGTTHAHLQRLVD